MNSIAELFQENLGLGPKGTIATGMLGGPLMKQGLDPKTSPIGRMFGQVNPFGMQGAQALSQGGGNLLQFLPLITGSFGALNRPPEEPEMQFAPGGSLENQIRKMR